MARSEWKNRSWLRKFAWHRGAGRADCMPEAYFQEKLLLERKRALRSNKPLVVMTLGADELRDPERPGSITEYLSKAVHACVRESDICGLLKEDVLIGVILTEIDAEKVGKAQLVVAGKTREKLKALLNHEMADRISIAFHTFPAGYPNALSDRAAPADLVDTSNEPTQLTEPTEPAE